MTLSTTNARNDYVGSNSVGPFPYTFKIFAATDLRVVKRNAATGVESVLAYPADFSVTGAGLAAGGSITLTAPLATNDVLSIIRGAPLTQPTSFRNQGSFLPESHENALDRLTMLVQQLKDAFDRALHYGDTMSPANFSAALPVPDAGKVMSGTGTGFTMSTVATTNPVALPGEGRTVATLDAFLLNNAVYSVRDYGALANGSHDDSPNIQAAIDAAFNAGGGIVRMLSGVHKTTTKLTVKRNVTLEGASRDNGSVFGSVISNTNATGVDILETSGRDWKIRNISVLGATGGGRGVVVAASCLGGLLENLYIDSVGGKGVHMLGDNALHRLSNVRVNGGQSNGFHFDASANSIDAITCVSCYANACGLSGALSGWLFDGAFGCTGMALMGCAGDNNTFAGFQLGSFYGTLTSCTAEVNTSHGFRIDGVGNIVLTAPFTSSQASPISIAAAANVTIINPRTSTTTSGFSITVTGAGTGANVLIGSIDTGILDQGIQVQSGGVLHRPDGAPVALTYGATITPDAILAGPLDTVTVTNGSAFTMAAPLNPSPGRSIVFEFLNSSGGAMGAVTWNAVYLLAGALTNPANTKRRKIGFTYNGTNWIEDFRSVADI